MKKITAVIALLFVTAFFKVQAQSISKIVLSVDSSTLAGKCPHQVKFNAVLTSAGQLKVAELRWERSDGTLVSVKNVPLSGKGNDTVTYNWAVTNAFNGSLTLIVSTASNYTGSNSVHFKVTCK